MGLWCLFDLQCVFKALGVFGFLSSGVYGVWFTGKIDDDGLVCWKFFSGKNAWKEVSNLSLCSLSPRWDFLLALGLLFCGFLISW